LQSLATDTNQHTYKEIIMKKIVSLILIVALPLALFACGTPVAIPNPPLVMGEKYLSDLDYEQALLQFDQAIIIEPKNPRGYLGKADALLHLDRQEDAAAALGDGVKAVPRGQREPLRLALTEVEKSSVNGYIGIASAYNKMGWREIALALLRRVCEELPAESRLRDALERLTISENEATANQVGISTSPIVVPDDVFNEKDMEAFLGSEWNTDVYSVAEKFGFSRATIDEVRSNVNPNEDSLSTYWNVYLNNICFGVTSNNNPYPGFVISFQDSATDIVFPRGIRIGMSADEVVERFCHSMENNLPAMAPQDLYLFEMNGANYHAKLTEIQDDPNLDSQVFYTFGKDLPNSMGQSCNISFICRQGIVKVVNIGFHTYDMNPIPEETIP